MSDIAERLHQGVDPNDIQETEAAMDRGAAEIERLSAALQIIYGMATTGYMDHAFFEAQRVARAALAGRKE